MQVMMVSWLKSRILRLIFRQLYEQAYLLYEWWVWIDITSGKAGIEVLTDGLDSSHLFGAALLFINSQLAPGLTWIRSRRSQTILFKKFFKVSQRGEKK